MILKLERIINSEKIHHFDEDCHISSFFNKIFYKDKSKEISIKLPISIFEMFFGQFRIFRRFLRLDMCNVFKSNNQLIIIRRGWVYNYDLTSNKLSRVLKLKQCRNILHQSMCKSSNGDLYFGEYGMNPKRNSVNIYRSKDKGKSWHVIYSFQKGSIRHVHGCYYDVFSNSIWVLTGDLNNENIILKSDLGFKNIEIIGDGSQSFRAVNLFFTENYVHWIMDSPFKKNYQFSYNRITKEINKLNFFNGPIWYLKKLNDGYFLAGSSVEKGPGVLNNKACLYVSQDLLNWKILEVFEKDNWPMPYFKWGVLAFSNGNQTSKKFTLHFEGLKKVDGKSFICKIIKY